MLPGQLPPWLDYALSENTAAAMFRGLQGLSARWGELIAAAQAVMGSYQDLLVGSTEQLYDEPKPTPMTCGTTQYINPREYRHGAGFSNADRPWHSPPIYRERLDGATRCRRGVAAALSAPEQQVMIIAIPTSLASRCLPYA
jgi:hypothetical protein